LPLDTVYSIILRVARHNPDTVNPEAANPDNINPDSINPDTRIIPTP
jgi:hypothetical protein